MAHPLLGVADVRMLAARLDRTPRKALGQHFVIDPNTIRRLVRLAGVQRDQVVLEIGPGLGSLTLGLLAAGARVLAVETDRVLAEALPGTVAERLPAAVGALRVLHADALRLPQLPGPAPTALVANLPYNLAVPILLEALARLPSLASGLVMVQAEVAQRLAAGPGSRTYGGPSVKLAYFAAARRAGTVSRAVFWPAPRVDSELVAFTRHESPPDLPRSAVFPVVDAVFAQRRKTLRAGLSHLAGSPERAARLLAEAGIDPASRGESLDVAAFVRLAAAFAAAGS